VVAIATDSAGPDGDCVAGAVGLAALEPHGRQLDAVRDRVAQHVLERAGHAFEHGPVELDVPAADVEVRPLFELLRGLPHDAMQPVGDRSDRHHAHAHQVLLQFAVEARLREQPRFGLVHGVDQILVHRLHVVH